MLFNWRLEFEKRVFPHSAFASAADKWRATRQGVFEPPTLSLNELWLYHVKAFNSWGRFASTITELDRVRQLLLSLSPRYRQYLLLPGAPDTEDNPSTTHAEVFSFVLKCANYGPSQEEFDDLRLSAAPTSPARLSHHSQPRHGKGSNGSTHRLKRSDRDTTAADQARTPFCLRCLTKGHQAAACEQALTAAAVRTNVDRVAKAKAAKRCVSCNSPDHRADTCPAAQLPAEDTGSSDSENATEDNWSEEDAWPGDNYNEYNNSAALPAGLIFCSPRVEPTAARATSNRFVLPSRSTPRSSVLSTDENPSMHTVLSTDEHPNVPCNVLSSAEYPNVPCTVLSTAEYPSMHTVLSTGEHRNVPCTMLSTDEYPSMHTVLTDSTTTLLAQATNVMLAKGTTTLLTESTTTLLAEGTTTLLTESTTTLLAEGTTTLLTEGTAVQFAEATDTLLTKGTALQLAEATDEMLAEDTTTLLTKGTTTLLAAGVPPRCSPEHLHAACRSTSTLVAEAPPHCPPETLLTGAPPRCSPELLHSDSRGHHPAARLRTTTLLAGEPPRCSPENHHAACRSSSTLLSGEPSRCSPENHHAARRRTSTLLAGEPPRCSLENHHAARRSTFTLLAGAPSRCSLKLLHAARRRTTMLLAGEPQRCSPEHFHAARRSTSSLLTGAPPRCSPELLHAARRSTSTLFAEAPPRCSPMTCLVLLQYRLDSWQHTSTSTPSSPSCWLALLAPRPRLGGACSDATPPTCTMRALTVIGSKTTRGF